MAGIVRNVGRGAAHVEADQPHRLAVREMPAGGCDHADHSARRTGQDGILATEHRGAGKAAIGLHELEARIRRQPGGHAVDVAAENRRQIGVDQRRVAAPDQLDQRRHLVTDRNLRKSKLLRDCGEPRLVSLMLPAVDEQDCDCGDALAPKRRQSLSRGLFVELPDHLAADSDPLVDFEDALVELLGKENVWAKMSGRAW